MRLSLLCGFEGPHDYRTCRLRAKQVIATMIASVAIATRIGAPAVLVVNGALLVAVAAYFLIRRHRVPEL